MHYPWWYVGQMTAPMLIALVAVIHMMVAHYAVGGGLFLAVETSYAYRTQNREYLAYLKGHARFFVLLTVAFGAITGVGIWWTIGLASPLATHILISTFVFAWATEYVFFLIEIVSAFVFYYYWGRLPEKIHTIIVWIYGISAWASLAIIGAITAFMLDPGNWPNDHNFWSAFLNRQALPQIVSRTGGSLLLSSLYVYLHSAIYIQEDKLHSLIESRSTRPALLGAILIAVGGLWWYLCLPASAQAALSAAPVLNVFMGVLFAATGIVFVLLYLGPYRNPGWIKSPGFAAALLLFGIMGMSTAEFIREAVRKPYICYNVVLGSQMTTEEVATVRKNGFLESGVWTKAYLQSNYPQVMTADGHVDRSRLVALPHADRVTLGGVIFQYHCNDCHAVRQGYSPLGPLVQGWSPTMLRSLVNDLNRTRFVMPPWTGSPEETELLVSYLSEVSPPNPQGMMPSAIQGGAAQGDRP